MYFCEGLSLEKGWESETRQGWRELFVWRNFCWITVKLIFLIL
jgi:hypothetical protein